MPRTHPHVVTATPMHLTIDPWWELVEANAFGTVADMIGPERHVELVEDRVALVLDATMTEVTGFVVVGYTGPDSLDIAEEPTLWGSPSFDVPVLGLRAASVGEVLTAIRGRFGAGEPTADAMHFHRALDERDPAAALPDWQLALEAGDMKAHYAIGYTLCELGRHREAYGHLRFYTELTPGNAWAWCWLGQACEGCSLPDEARTAYRWAIALDEEETDAAERLAELG